MQISKLRIENFRSIKSAELSLDETTVFIGPNNAGKSAVIEAVRIALSRRWGQRGTGFTEHDVHLDDERSDPRTAPPVKISFDFCEPNADVWPEDMVAALEDIMILTHEGINRISFSITYRWNEEKENFEPAWEFLNAAGDPLPPRRRSINLSGFYDYILFMWLGALRDVDSEFSSRSRNWGGLLKTIKIPEALEASIKQTLDDLDTSILSADGRLGAIADTIGMATQIAMEDSPGGAKLRMLPMNVWDMLSRAGVILRNESERPWLPLGHHGQGLQSLSVMFLFHAAAAQQIADDLHEGAEPIFAIEEPEAHLHPQAARTLWERLSRMPGQKLVTTHSPYFVQNVPLHNLRIVRFREGATQVSHLPRSIASEIPWTQEVENFVTGRRLGYLYKDPMSGNVSSTAPFEEEIQNGLTRCWRGKPNHTEISEMVALFRRTCRVLVTSIEEEDLSFLGRRIRGEIFFARKWVLVEGVSEYLLLNALGKVHNYDLDQHGIAVIDFQNNGNASIYAALADAFGFPWCMVTDGDGESENFKSQLTKRGFNDDDVVQRFKTLPPPHDLEDQLLADGHESLLRQIVHDLGVADALTCTQPELLKRIKNRKTGYMAKLSLMVSGDMNLAARMPAAFVRVIENLKDGTFL